MTDKTDSKEREAFIAFLMTFPRSYTREIAEHYWDNEHVSALAWRAGRASLAASAGSEPVANNRPSLESVFRGLSDRAYCNYIEQMRRNECLGWEHKVKHGTFGEAELKAHTLAWRLLGRHHAFAEAANALRGSDAPLTHPSPPEGMVGGWMPIETAPRDGKFLVRDGTWHGKVASTPKLSDVAMVERSDGGAFEVSDTDYYTAYITNPTGWMPLPPTTSAGSGKGE